MIRTNKCRLSKPFYLELSVQKFQKNFLRAWLHQVYTSFCVNLKLGRLTFQNQLRYKLVLHDKSSTEFDVAHEVAIGLYVILIHALDYNLQNNLILKDTSGY